MEACINLLNNIINIDISLFCIQTYRSFVKSSYRSGNTKTSLPCSFKTFYDSLLEMEISLNLHRNFAK